MTGRTDVADGEYRLDDSGFHKGPWVVIDEARDERTIWGPFDTVAACERWMAELLRQYDEDGEDQSSYIDYEAVFHPIGEGWS